MIYHLLHFFYWKVFKKDKMRNPQSKRPTFIFGNCMSRNANNMQKHMTCNDMQ